MNFICAWGGYEKKKPPPPLTVPLIIIIVVCVTPLLTTRAVMTTWLGSCGQTGGEDEHKRGIKMAKN